jgi:hypothetical protein
MNPLISFVSIAALALLGGCNYTDASGRPFFSAKIEPLPAEYAHYKFIEDIKEFGHHTIERFNVPSRSTVEHSINKVTNNVIIQVATDLNPETRQHVFYKLDTTGVVIDQHQFKRSFLIKDQTGEEEIVDGVYLINLEKGYYTTWPLNGDKTQRPFTPVNQDLAWSTEQVDAFYNDVVKQSTRLDDVESWHINSDGDGIRRINKVFYLNKTGKWYILYSKSLGTDYSGKSIKGFNTLFTGFTDVERGFGRYTPPANIAIPHFQKEKYEKFCASNQVGCSMFYTWEGTGYYQVKVGDSTLNFKNKASLSRTDFKGEEFPAKESLLVNFAYYTNPNLKYSMFSANEALYLIKEK